jgi:DNA polymerase I
VRRRLLVVDGDSFTHRAYHGFPKNDPTSRRQRRASYRRVCEFCCASTKTNVPRAVWDTLEAPTYRHDAFANYQSGRDFDAELCEQLEVLLQFVSACGFASAKASGDEADDILAAAVSREERRGGTVTGPIAFGSSARTNQVMEERSYEECMAR